MQAARLKKQKDELESERKNLTAQNEASTELVRRCLTDLEKRLRRITVSVNSITNHISTLLF